LQLLEYALPHWGGLAVVIALMMATVGLDALGPWPLKLLVDNVLGGVPLPDSVSWLSALPGGGSSMAHVAWLAVGTILLFLASHVVQMVRSYVETGVGNRMAYDLGADLFEHLQHLSLRFHGRHATGDLLRRVTSDSGCVKQLVIGALAPMVNAVLSLVTLFLVMWHMDAPLSVMAILVAPPLGLLIRIFARPMAERTYDQQQMEGQMMALTEQTLSSLPVVQAFGREDDEERRFRVLSSRTLQAYLRAVVAQLQFKAGVGGVMAVGTAVLMGIGGIHVLRGSLSVGGLLVFLSYLASLYAPMTTLAYLSSGFAAAAGGAKRVLEIMGKRREVEDRPGARPLPASSAKGRRIAMENVTFGYERTQPVLRQVTLEVQPGEVVALVGPTGVGKTTLVSLIPRFFDPWEGRVTVDGVDVRDVLLSSLRAEVALVLQDPFLLPLSVAENVAYGRPEASRDEIRRAAALARADAFIRNLPQGYDTVIGEGGATLSGGERQRLAIARALLKDASVLILDEPTASLDAGTETELLDALERLMEGRTTFVIAHRLSTVRRADRIVVLEDGQVLEMGSHYELLARGGLYARLFALQFGDPEAALIAGA
jgi:ATP-binding cassette subfamily B protein/subfamily B ATP-binding cassette protein MsbA